MENSGFCKRVCKPMSDEQKKKFEEALESVSRKIVDMSDEEFEQAMKEAEDDDLTKIFMKLDSDFPGFLDKFFEE